MHHESSRRFVRLGRSCVTLSQGVTEESLDAHRHPYSFQMLAFYQWDGELGASLTLEFFEAFSRSMKCRRCRCKCWLDAYGGSSS